MRLKREGMYKVPDPKKLKLTINKGRGKKVKMSASLENAAEALRGLGEAMQDMGVRAGAGAAQATESPNTYRAQVPDGFSQDRLLVHLYRVVNGEEQGRTTTVPYVVGGYVDVEYICRAVYRGAFRARHYSSSQFDSMCRNLTTAINIAYVADSCVVTGVGNPRLRVRVDIDAYGISDLDAIFEAEYVYL